VRLRLLSLTLVILCFTSQLVLSADVQSTVGDFFSDSISSRFRAQRDFYDYFRTDPAAINALVDKALGNITSVPGEYDTLSILDRLPASSVTQSELRDKIVLLANHASGNSLDTARKAANVLVKFRAVATPPSDSSSVPETSHYGPVWQRAP
jgi:hypothetical protein